MRAAAEAVENPLGHLNAQRVHIRGVVIVGLWTQRAELQHEVLVLLSIVDLMRLQKVGDLERPNLIKARHMDAV